MTQTIFGTDFIATYSLTNYSPNLSRLKMLWFVLGPRGEFEVTKELSCDTFNNPPHSHIKPDFLVSQSAALQFARNFR